MSTEGTRRVESFVASGDLRTLQYRVVDLLADKRIGHALSARGFGVLLNKPATTEHASVAVKGEVKLRAGAAMTVGSLFAASGSGWVTAFAGPTTSPASGGPVRLDVVLGRAKTACASGSLFEADFDPFYISVASA